MPPFTFPQQLASLFFEPKRYRPHGIGYWSGHIPFACDLIHTFRPRVFVELGTHQGESYFAFCQAIAESGAATKAYAVDTWRGDQHTGAYSDLVFQEVEACNQPYAAFSTLLRLTFDDAFSRFERESIDLLHIDGAHVYEVVRRDFETWWPKVKPGGVVLLHDSFERSHGFGVWQLLAEVSQRYAASEFQHSHGLAVICKPPLAASNIAAVFATTDDGTRAAMRRYYEMRAASLLQSFVSKHRQPGDWEVTSQLFWRTAEVGFTEECSVRAADVVGAQATTVILPIPASPEPFAGFRVAASLTPALIALHEIAVYDASGTAIWSETAARDTPRWQQTGLRCVLDRDRALLTDTPDGALFDPVVPRNVLAILAQGGSLRMTLSGLDAFSFVSILAAQSGHHSAEGMGEPPGE